MGLLQWVNPDTRVWVDSLAQLGFRRWYERQLIISHAWIASCFVAIVLFATGLELFTGSRDLAEFIADALMIGAALVFAWVAWRQYACRMVMAESIGGQANCMHCGHYGFRIDVQSSQRQAFKVFCPKCKHRWEVYKTQ
jgi:hypothetical protein